MTLRRALATCATFVVAVAMMLALPIAQLPARASADTCCTGAKVCHCAPPPSGHAPGHGPSMRACHTSPQAADAPTLPSFTAPVVAPVAPRVRAVPAPLVALAAPHAAPALRRPAAPS